MSDAYIWMLHGSGQLCYGQWLMELLLPNFLVSDQKQHVKVDVVRKKKLKEKEIYITGFCAGLCSAKENYNLPEDGLMQLVIM